MDCSTDIRNLIIEENSDSEMFYDQDKIIEEAITTPYEKVLKILSTTKSFLIDLNTKDNVSNFLRAIQIAKDIEWVIKRIQSHTLYAYEIHGDLEELEKISEDTSEIKNYIEFLSNYSEAKELKGRNKKDYSSRTNIIPYSQFQNDSSLFYSCNTTKNKRGQNYFSSLSEGIKFKTNKIESKKFHEKLEQIIEDKKSFENFNSSKFKKDNSNEIWKNTFDDINNISSVTRNKSSNKETTLKVNSLDGITIQKKVSSKNFQKKEELSILMSNRYVLPKVSKSISNNLPNSSVRKLHDEGRIKKKMSMMNINSISQINESTSLTLNNIKPIIIQPNLIADIEIDEKSILSKYFDIHEFDYNVGRARVLPIIGKTVYKAMDLTEIVNIDKLDGFLNKLSDGYCDKVQYHNSVHAADVVQTLAIFLLNSNLEEIILLTSIDILSLISAGLGHDIGHPGTTNGFHINTCSQMAINYNDNSVLENFHTSSFFKICLENDYNIFDKLPDPYFKQLRKRIISLILSTDMTAHAKVISLIKPKILEYRENINKLKITDNIIPFISPESELVFDEQQKIMDFILHAADISHNSKIFKISYKWTQLLMEEFYQQGDIEKTLGIPVSFLCDRGTVNVPNSQIGFIRSIVWPCFEVLIELLPSLSYLQGDIEKNLEEWSKMIDKSTRRKSLFSVYPRILFTNSPRTNKKSHTISNRNSLNHESGNINIQNPTKLYINRNEILDEKTKMDEKSNVNI